MTSSAVCESVWPWEHLAFGYLLYSVAARVRSSPLTRGEALAVAVGTQFSDVVDKPLAWGLGVLPGGVLAHTLVVAVPASGVALLVARWRDRTAAGAAFAVGYLSHLVGDVLFTLLTSGGLAYRMLLWPFVANPTGIQRGITESVAYYFANYLVFLATPRGAVYAALEVALLGAAVLAWATDGRPGAGVVRRAIDRARAG